MRFDSEASIEAAKMLADAAEASEGDEAMKAAVLAQANASIALVYELNELTSAVERVASALYDYDGIGLGSHAREMKEALERISRKS
ncbi:hypothetical protein [Micromonospora purpureochromogenes]|uniref:Excreted virulence factor EspC, type VII ESX diderm n=1 Tax=Micromonospora purpureochromogenes TaxID=47872 RepID=A0ABX2RMV8_9ACTN|nr:hypothetical protein [Micromonospora purpureochromogenes]NYF57877.1 hypothetical protein [Micromonospora purpureochromogenes]